MGFSKKVTLKILMSFLISPSCFSFDGIDIPDSRPFQNPAVIKLQKGVIYFDGQITPDSASETIKLIKKEKIKKLSVNSMGGDGESAINLAKEIYENKISVEVRTVCASACANYIFVAGKNKILSERSFLLWHGGMNGPEKDITIRGDMSRERFFELDAVKKMKINEVNFYRYLKINSKMPYCPQLKNDYTEKFPERWFSYTPSDIERFGIKSVHYIGGPSKWVLSAKKQHVIFATYCDN